MGEIADSIINGDFDYITGEYIGEGYGYPRTRDSGSCHHSNQNSVTKQLCRPLNERTQAVYKACEGMDSNKRHYMIDLFMCRIGKEALCNRSKYKIIFKRIEEFKRFLKKEKGQGLTRYNK